MREPIEHRLATVAGLAMMYAISGIPEAARAQQLRDVPSVPAEVAQWRSTLVDVRDVDAAAKWKSALGAIDADNAAGSRTTRSATGLPNGPQAGSRMSPGYSDGPQSARRSAKLPR